MYCTMMHLRAMLINNAKNHALSKPMKSLVFTVYLQASPVNHDANEPDLNACEPSC
jgi:hypothetical protein